MGDVRFPPDEKLNNFQLVVSYLCARFESFIKHVWNEDLRKFCPWSCTKHWKCNKFRNWDNVLSTVWTTNNSSKLYFTTKIIITNVDITSKKELDCLCHLCWSLCKEITQNYFFYYHSVFCKLIQLKRKSCSRK